MIRDGYKDVRKVTSKEERKKAAVGERAYYAKQIPKLKDINKSITVSDNIMLVTLSVFYALLLLVFILSLNSEEGSDTTRFIVWSAIYGAFLIWYFVWLFILKKNNEKKIERYKKELERLSAESISKTMGAYAIYGADYIQKLKEKNEKLAPKPAAQAIEEQTEQDKPLND